MTAVVMLVFTALNECEARTGTNRPRNDKKVLIVKRGCVKTTTVYHKP